MKLTGQRLRSEGRRESVRQRSSGSGNDHYHEAFGISRVALGQIERSHAVDSRTAGHSTSARLSILHVFRVCSPVWCPVSVRSSGRWMSCKHTTVRIHLTPHHQDLDVKIALPAEADADSVKFRRSTAVGDDVYRRWLVRSIAVRVEKKAGRVGCALAQCPGAVRRNVSSRRQLALQDAGADAGGKPADSVAHLRRKILIQIQMIK